MKLDSNTIIRFLEKIDDIGNCWIWTSVIMGREYHRLYQRQLRANLRIKKGYKLLR